MVRYVLPVAAILALIAGCGGTREQAPETQRAGAAPAPAAAPVAVIAPKVEKPRKRKGKGVPVAPTINQPAAPELPGDVSLATTPEMLSAQALLAAREQVESGLSGQADVAQRHAYILGAWQPLYQERQKGLTAIAAARERRTQHDLANAKLAAAHAQRLDAVEAEYEPKIRAERAKTVPILE